jgi:hypothetical protein
LNPDALCIERTSGSLDDTADLALWLEDLSAMAPAIAGVKDARGGDVCRHSAVSRRFD